MSQLIIYLFIYSNKKYFYLNKHIIQTYYLMKEIILKILLKLIDIFENISEKIDIITF